MKKGHRNERKKSFFIHFPQFATTDRSRRYKSRNVIGGSSCTLLVMASFVIRTCVYGDIACVSVCVQSYGMRWEFSLRVIGIFHGCVGSRIAEVKIVIYL